MATFSSNGEKGGKGNGGFNNAFGMATDSDGNVYVTDFFNRLIQKFDNKGNFLQEWLTEPTTYPAFMAIDAQDNIYIDQFPPYDTHYIEKFDKNGIFVSEWGKATLPLKGRVEDIAVDKEGNLYVTAALAHSIHRIDPNGKLLASFGGEVSSKGEGRFDVPAGITIDAEGNLYVIDTNFLQKLDKDGKFVAQWPRKGDLEEALNITVDAQSNLYILAKTEVKAATGTTLKVLVLKKFKQSW
jgi:DNA-binding beta-propeller fold protein YncE